MLASLGRQMPLTSIYEVTTCDAGQADDDIREEGASCV